MVVVKANDTILLYRLYFWVKFCTVSLIVNRKFNEIVTIGEMNTWVKQTEI